MKSPDKLIQIGFVQSVVDFFIACISLGFLQELKVVDKIFNVIGMSKEIGPREYQGSWTRRWTSLLGRRSTSSVRD